MGTSGCMEGETEPPDAGGAWVCSSGLEWQCFVAHLLPTRWSHFCCTYWLAGLTCFGSFSHLMLTTNWGANAFAEALQDPGICSSYVETPNFARWWIKASGLSGAATSVSTLACMQAHHNAGPDCTCA